MEQYFYAGETEQQKPMKQMYILPAVDLHLGQAVRLEQGDYNKVKVYDQPVAAAQKFIKQGATHLHVVDLDGAKGGTQENLESIKKLAALDLFVEVGGGIRSRESIEEYLSLGVSRCILGTVAVKDFAFTKEVAKNYGEKIAVGVDARDGMVAVNGWLENTREDSLNFCRRLRDAGVQCIIYTDISRDGMLSGCNMEVYEGLVALGIDIVASGGVSSIAELRGLRSMGCAGAIVGKAIYEGLVSLEAAIQVGMQ